MDRAASAGNTYPKRHMSIVVGRSAEKYINMLAGEYMERFGGQIDVRMIRNDFYGESITVTGSASKIVKSDNEPRFEYNLINRLGLYINDLKNLKQHIDVKSGFYFESLNQ